MQTFGLISLIIGLIQCLPLITCETGEPCSVVGKCYSLLICLVRYTALNFFMEQDRQSLQFKLTLT